MLQSKPAQHHEPQRSSAIMAQINSCIQRFIQHIIVQQSICTSCKSHRLDLKSQGEYSERRSSWSKFIQRFVEHSADTATVILYTGACVVEIRLFVEAVGQAEDRLQINLSLCDGS